jgi:N-methylhydantoinase A
VSLPQGRFVPEDRPRLEALMRNEYERVFGRTVHGVPLEIVNLRLDARATRGDRAIDFDHASGADGSAVKGSRPVYFDEAGQHLETAVHDRIRLRPGEALSGPAVIEEKDTTIIVPPGATTRVDGYRNIITTLPAASTGVCA